MTVFLLFLSAYTQHEYQRFHSDSGMALAGGDFSVYYIAGKIANGAGGRQLYDPVLIEAAKRKSESVLVANPSDDTSAWRQVAINSGAASALLYIYPPFFSLTMIPFAYLSFHSAFWLWRELLVIFLLASIYFTLRIADLPARTPVFFIASIGALCFFPFIESVYVGQVGPLILLLWTCGAYLLKVKWDKSSAVIFALATLIKLTPVLVLPLIILRKRWSWVISYVVGLAVLMGCSIWILGWHNHWIYFRDVLPAVGEGIARRENKSIPGLILQIAFGHTPFSEVQVLAPVQGSVAPLIAKGLGVVIYAGSLFWMFVMQGSDKNLPNELALLALISLVISPVSWRHHYVLALLPLLVLWCTHLTSDRGSRGRIAMLTVATLAIGSWPVGDLILPAVHPLVLRLLVGSVMLAGALICIYLFRDVLQLQDSRHVSSFAVEALADAEINP